MKIVYDLEVFPNYFSCAAKDIKTGKKYFFYIHKSVNQFLDFLIYLNDVKGMIGFNNLAYDYPIIHFLLKNQQRLSKLPADSITNEIYNMSYSIIQADRSEIWESEHYIPQLDLYKINHFDNNAKRTSLKWIEFYLRLPEVQDLPYSPNTIIDNSMLDELKEYNFKDVEATEIFYHKCIPAIKLRSTISKKFGKNFRNFNDVKIGEHIFLQMLSKSMGIPEKELKKMRTQRPVLSLNDCILNKIQFEDDRFAKLLKKLKSKVITTTKNAFKEVVNYDNIQLCYGTGGLHGSVEAGIYQSDKNHILVDLDVALA